jgi:type IV pilus assembly protein PilN
MYGLDINFLKDRAAYAPAAGDRRRRTRASAATESKQPLYLGLLTGGALLALAGGAWLWLQTTNDGLNARKADLDTKLVKLQQDQAALKGVQAQTAQIQAQTTALAGVFDYVKPWSALFNDIVGRVPPRVRITEIKELSETEVNGLPDVYKVAGSATPAPAPSPGAAPATAPQRVVQVSGTATSFNDMNDFLLNLQQSKLFNPAFTKVLSSQLGQPRQLQSPADIAPGTSSNTQVTLPPEAEFKIIATLTDQPSSKLLPELERNKATGLVTRIETLQQKGVIKQ